MQKSASHYTEAAYDEIEILRQVQEGDQVGTRPTPFGCKSSLGTHDPRPLDLYTATCKLCPQVALTLPAAAVGAALCRG